MLDTPRYIECGTAPTELGVFYIRYPECMFYLYLPIKMARDLNVNIPEPLLKYKDLVRSVSVEDGWDLDDYVYLTAKTMFVTESCPGNRPGWHMDGFGSGGDRNYIWSDMNPTEFAIQDFSCIPDDDVLSMLEIERQIDVEKIVTYPDNTLLRLDERVVHRVSPRPAAGLRSFFKLTVSKHRFRNEGNSHNWKFDYSWRMKPRSIQRNLDHG